MMLSLWRHLGLLVPLHLTPHAPPPPPPPPPPPVVVVAPTSVHQSAPVLSPPATDAPTVAPAPTPASCGLTWTLTQPYGFGNADGEMAAPGTTGTWSTPCDQVGSIEAQFPTGTAFVVSPDPGPTT